jgi:hypothetical protein
VQVVGESPPTPIVSGVNSFPVRIPVKAGDLIGSSGVLMSGSETLEASVVCSPGPVGDRVGLIAGTPFVGATVPFETEEVDIGNPITVSVEPDADGDGFGDETQDKCPTDASTQGPCPVKAAPPAPTPPITLSASAAAKKGLVTVSLTSTAQATVTVGGSVKLGKGKSATLTGGSQIVAPGSLANFTVLFPAKLKARLKQLPPSQKLSLTLSATAPGATTTSLTVKVPGQKKAQPTHHHRA